MAEIFISYKSERRAAAEHFAEVLRRHGFTVWFDYELVKGADFAAQIERQIREAKALVALWCSLSVSSRWVREEVHLAHDLGILVPVKIEACEIPFGFRLADTIDLTGWDGAPRSPALDPLIDALEGRIGRDAAPDRKALIEYEGAWRRFGGAPAQGFRGEHGAQPHGNAALRPGRRKRPAGSTACGGASRRPQNGLLQWSQGGMGAPERQRGHRPAPALRQACPSLLCGGSLGAGEGERASGGGGAAPGARGGKSGRWGYGGHPLEASRLWGPWRRWR